MARLFLLRIFLGLLLVLLAQTADHYERKKRHPRATSLTDSELRNKLDSIISMVGKLNDKIDEQEQRIAVLSRKVSDIECNGTPKKGMLISNIKRITCVQTMEPCERHACPEQITLFLKSFFSFFFCQTFGPPPKNERSYFHSVFSPYQFQLNIMLFVRDLFIQNIDLPNHNRNFKDPKSSH